MNDWKDLGNQSQSMNNVLGNVTFGDGKNEFTFAPQQIIQISADKIKLDKLNPISPYRGLKPFENNEFDSNLFFGRDQLIGRLMENLTDRNLLLLLGASGSGKSSVIKAGLIPQLRKNLGTKFCELIFKPSQNPFFRLFVTLSGKFGDEVKESIVMSGQPETLIEIVSTLKKPEDYWLIYIDQFEELFTSSEPDKRENFIQGLGLLYRFLRESQSQSVKIVMTMRADFLDRFDPFPVLGEITRGNIELITTMYEDELRQAIEQPAAKHGVVFEDGLVKTVIEDIKGQSGSLPLLQYTLDLLWKRDNIADPNDLTKPHPHTDRELNIDTYNSLGGVRGALQSHIEEVYTQKLKTSAQQEVTKQIFLKLVQWISGEGGQYIPVSQRRLLSHFEIGIEVETLDIFINERLIVSNVDNLSQKALQDVLDNKQQATVEIAHEILISAWERLKKWIGEAKDVLIAKSQLQADMARYEHVFKNNQAKANDELLVGSRLEKVLELWDDGMFELRNISLESEEIKFIEKSIEWRDRQTTEKENQITKLNSALMNATLQEQVSSSWNILSVNPKNAIKMAISALGLNFKIKREISSSVLSSLQRIVVNPKLSNLKEYTPELKKYNPELKKEYSFSEDFKNIRFIDKSTHLLTICYDSYESGIAIWDIAGKLIHETNNTTFHSPNGQFLVTYDNEGKSFILNLKNKQVKYFSDYYVSQVDFSPNGEIIAALVRFRDERTDILTKELILVNVEGSILLKIKDKAEQISCIKFSPNNNFLCISIISKSFNSKFEDIHCSQIHLWSITGDLLWKSKVYEGFTTWISFESDQVFANFNINREDCKQLDESNLNSISLKEQKRVSVIRKWDIDGQLREETNHDAIINPINFCDSNADILICTDNEKNLYCWQNSKCIWKKKAEIHIECIDKIIINSHQKIIATIESLQDTCYSDITIVCLWDFEGNLIYHFPSEIENDKLISLSYSDYKSISREVKSTSLDIGKFFVDPNSNYITSVSIFGQVSIWSWSGVFLKELRASEGHIIKNSSISFNNEFLATINKYDFDYSNQYKLSIWDLRSNLITLIPYNNSDKSNNSDKNIRIDFLQFSDLNNLTVYSPRKIRVFDVTGILLEQIEVPFNISINFLSDRVYSGTENEQKSAFCDFENFAVTGFNSGKILLHLYDQNTYKKSWKAHDSCITAIAYCHQTQVIATGDTQGQIKLWNLEGELFIDGYFQGFNSGITALNFSLDGEILASGDFDGNIGLWRAGWRSYLTIACERISENFNDNLENDPISQNAYETCKRYIWLPKSDELYEQGLDKMRHQLYQESIYLFNESIEYNSENIEAYYNRGRSYALLQDFDKSSQDFGQAIGLIKSQIHPLYTLLYHAVRFQHPKRRRYISDPFLSLAEDYLTAIYFLQNKPNLADVYFYRGGSYSKLHNLQKAKADWQVADRLYKIQMSSSANAKKVQEFLAHPSIVNLDKS